MSADTDNQKKAAKLLKTKLAEVETGTHSDSRRITYEELREMYYADYVTKKRKSLRRDQEGNARLDKVVRLDNFFEGYRASEIDASLMKKFVAAEQTKELSDGSINRSLSALRHMFHLAKQEDKIRHLPYFPMQGEADPRQSFFSRVQYDELFRVLPDYLRLPFAIGYYSGMRLGEILGLKWEHEAETGVPGKQVDFIRGIIHLRQTKNGHARDLPMVSQLRTLLVEQHARRQDCPYVCFRLDRKGNAVKVMGFRKAWYSSCIKAGLGKMVPAMDRITGKPLFAPPRGPRSKPKAKLEYEGMIFHDLWRTGVRNLIRAGRTRHSQEG
jgi:integrase